MNDVKQVIIARRDLDLSPGKLGAQVAHACEDCISKHFQMQIELINENDTGDFYQYDDYEYICWKNSGGKKIVLMVQSEAKLIKYHRLASETLLLVSDIIIDEGHTEIDPGTATCFAIGPNFSEEIDKITAKLPSYK